MLIASPLERLEQAVLTSDTTTDPVKHLHHRRKDIPSLPLESSTPFLPHKKRNTMIAFLQRYNVGRRLGVAFGLLILLSCLLVAEGLYSMSTARKELDNIVKVNVEKTRISHGMLEANSNIMIALGTVSMATSEELNQEALAEITQNRQRYSELRKELDGFPADSERVKKLRAEIDAERTVCRALNDQVTALAQANRNAEAQALLSERARPAMVAWLGKINENVALQEEGMQLAYAEATQAMTSGRNMLIAGGVAVLIISSLLAWLITRSLTHPLNRATRIAEAIADGRLDNDVRTEALDEPGRLLNAMDRMQTQLQRFSSETALMIELHADKDMTHRMPLDFPGVYGDLSKGINTMMFEHLDAIVDAIAVLNEYANGDLRRDARRLPGSRVVLHESMDAAKASLMAINTEIKRLAAAAAAGDFSVRGDEQRFQYDFQVMVQGLNAMMGVSDQSLGQLSSLLQSIAAGDLTARMHGDYNGVFASMRDDANATASQLADIVGQIRTGSDAINTAASEISSGNSDLAQRTEQQAANLEETAASMEELTSTVRQNAESARQANQLAIGAASVASQGGEVVGQVVTTMSAIQTSSKKIAEIISVIDGIAFQTNILALNAAVEAARAGEQGRGFAVVASEVRTLAQRSAAAAKEIKGLIEDSVERVSDGSALVDKAGQTMGEIVASVQRVTDIMSEISAASQEQSAGIEQVNQTITQMDETTQQNAALVEEASAAARSMEEQAEQLVQTVAVFRLDGDRAADRKPSAAVASASVTRLPPVAGRKPAGSRPTASRAKPAAKLRSNGAATPAEASAEWQEF